MCYKNELTCQEAQLAKSAKTISKPGIFGSSDCKVDFNGQKDEA